MMDCNQSSNSEHSSLLKQRQHLRQILDEQKEEKKKEVLLSSSVASGSCNDYSPASVSTLGFFSDSNSNFQIADNTSKSQWSSSTDFIPVNTSSAFPDNEQNLEAESNIATSNDDHLQEESNDDDSCEKVTKVILFGPEEMSLPKKKVSRNKKIPWRSGETKVVYPCEWMNCSVKIEDLKAYFHHIQEHLDESKLASDSANYVCQWRICGREFCDVQEFERHVLFHGFHVKIKEKGQFMMDNFFHQTCKADSDGANYIPAIPDAFECQWDNCDAVYFSAQHFYWHIEAHAHSPENVYENDKQKVKCGWRGCGKTLSRVSFLKDHSRSHSQEKCIGCPTCGATFSTPHCFKMHIDRQAPLQDVVYQCSFCSRRFKTETLVREHARFHINLLKCPHCDMTCNTRASLSNHILYKHTDARPMKCDQCDSRFKTRQDLERHSYTHYKEKKFKCHFNKCNFTATNMQWIDRHLKAHQQNNTHPIYACHLCDVELERGTYLSKHLMKDHNLTWPSGHSRFFYQLSADGKHRLRTIRYESADLVEGEDKFQKTCEEEEENEDEMIGEEEEEDEEEEEVENAPVEPSREPETEPNQSFEELPDITNKIETPSKVSDDEPMNGNKRKRTLKGMTTETNNMKKSKNKSSKSKKNKGDELRVTKENSGDCQLFVHEEVHGILLPSAVRSEL